MPWPSARPPTPPSLLSPRLPPLVTATATTTATTTTPTPTTTTVPVQGRGLGWVLACACLLHPHPRIYPSFVLCALTEIAPFIVGPTYRSSTIRPRAGLPEINTSAYTWPSSNSRPLAHQLALPASCAAMPHRYTASSSCVRTAAC